MTFITGFEVFWVPRTPDTSICKCESAKIKENSTHYRTKYKGLSDHGLSPAEWAETFRAPSLVSRAFVWEQGGGYGPISQRRRRDSSTALLGQRAKPIPPEPDGAPDPVVLCPFVSLFQAYLLPRALSHPPLRDAFPPFPPCYVSICTYKMSGNMAIWQVYILQQRHLKQHGFNIINPWYEPISLENKFTMF